MHFLYNLAIQALRLGLWTAAFFHPKARLWVDGRRDWRRRYAVFRAQHPNARVLWLHAASLGEFEQGRPIIEAFRAEFPDWKIVLSFFSPSGYELRKDYPHADWVCYLPADTRANARDFLDLVRPDAAVFVKYEFWANYLFALKKRGTPTLLVSALFRDTQPFFQTWGGFWRRMLAAYAHIFVQDKNSEKLLQGIGIQQVTLAGDTRVDRVFRIAQDARENHHVARFVSGAEQVLVLGSAWEADEKIVLDALQTTENQAKWRLILAPHEPSEAHVARVVRQVAGSLRYSQLDTGGQSHANAPLLVIDNVGLLNTLYRYGKVAYIGGGFGKGIHNTLEPAAFGLPIIFGPKYGKFEEAKQFVARGGAFCVQNADELAQVLKRLQDPDFYQKAATAVRAYLEESRGATEKVMAYWRTLSG